MRSWNILSLRCVDGASLPGLQPDVWEIDIRELIQGAPIRHFMSIAYIVFRYHKNITFFVPFRNRHHQNAVTEWRFFFVKFGTPNGVLAGYDAVTGFFFCQAGISHELYSLAKIGIGHVHW